MPEQPARTVLPPTLQCLDLSLLLEDLRASGGLELMRRSGTESCLACAKGP